MSIRKQNFVRRLLVTSICILLFAFIAWTIFMKTASKKPIIIGFDAQLTGKQSEIGVQERNGVQLAVEKINALGGINGRKIQLMIRDDLGMPEQAKKMDSDLIKLGAVAIIGHATSEETLAGVKMANDSKEIMIGPTVSTPKLTGIDDYFFHVYPSFNESSKAFAEYIYKKNNLKQMCIIYDTDNKAYSEDYVEIFENKFKSLGGNINEEISFSSKSQSDFSSLLSKLNDSKPQGIFIIASDIDTAMIAQKIRAMNLSLPLYASSWAQTPTLITNGGTAVEGMKVEQCYVPNSKSQVFKDFQDKYKTRFGNEPSFGAAFGYEAASMLTDALKRNEGKKKGLKEQILKNSNPRGIMDSFSVDKLGDTKIPFYLSSINGGQFVVLEQLSPANVENSIN
ncbi:ABC transporter substrate-binding protein [Clostridium carboxidivorans P7]|uniref:Extracellular ligand-binding receptor n=1 Tax=Clostridium carboxidivorans P7 TaxID=536227 RepID=C6PUC6_9CLOT|nr:ABC transporter substrate-binding protein [Clostridium carboxidivorans]AKN30570.1 ABC transporter substrate-binding protein [Clostridium carboxidivorans P7]EET87124.1 Extracellular ligand-binding receptor [Clostridium carboxidivorans P7]EFG86318.1 receptor family ligand-binding protein [Clostridium carboxidivorans P7]